MKKRYLIGVLFLFAQVISIVYARFTEERFFCWGPYDQHTYYEVTVKIDGMDLNKNEIEKRYRYKPMGWEPRSIHNVFSIIDQYESTYGQDQNAIVLVEYSTNGSEEKTWYLEK